jgi:hypothetical protein
VADKDQRGSRRFGGAWAKAEIFLGLTAAGAGLLLGVWQVSRPTGEIDWTITAAALALFVLGGYLTLAGQRSHLYRSNIETAASLREEIRRPQEQG